MMFAFPTLLAQNPTVPVTPAAERVAGSGIIPQCATKEFGADSLECVLELFINIADILLGVIGVVLLAIIVWGGLIYLTSSGEPDKVKKATQMFTGAAVGLLIVFGAFAAVSWGVAILRGDNTSEIAAQYYTCGTPFLRDERNVVIGDGNPQNDNQPCAPNATCRLGVCVDSASLQPVPTSEIIIESE
ncbi:MAG: pilin [Patescibacteria group bacterium]